MPGGWFSTVTRWKYIKIHVSSQQCKERSFVSALLAHVVLKCKMMGSPRNTAIRIVSPYPVIKRALIDRTAWASYYLLYTYNHCSVESPGSSQTNKSNSYSRWGIKQFALITLRTLGAFRVSDLVRWPCVAAVSDDYYFIHCERFAVMGD